MMKKWMSILLVALLSMSLSACSLFGDSNVIYVAADADGNGKSWKRACGTIEEALELAQPGQQIWVKEGTYDGGITLKDGVDLYGGFSGFERKLEERDLTKKPSVITGSLSDGTRAETVVTAANAVLDGFTITGGGRETGDSSALPTVGGGLTVDSTAPVIRNCVIKDNAADFAAGVLIRGGSPRFEGTTVSHNTAAFDGAGLWIDGGSDARFVDCSLDANAAGRSGGGMYLDGASPLVYNSLFVNNLAQVGGAVCSVNGAEAKIASSTLAYNTAHEKGSVLYQGAGSAAMPSLRDCIITSNKGSLCYSWNESGAAITYSVVQGGFPGEGNSDLSLTFSAGYVTDDPSVQSLSSTGGPVGCLGGVTADADAAFSAMGDMAGLVPMTVPDYSNPLTEGVYWNPVIFVSPDGTGGGTTWRQAMNLQDALDLAGFLYETKGKTTELWLKEGVYTPGENRSDSFILRPGVTLYGGFDGTEQWFNERDTANHMPVLSGEIGDPGTTSDNCYHVLIGCDNATVDGVIISGGNADGSSGQVYDRFGGGLLNYAPGEDRQTAGFSTVIRNSRFENNEAIEGGALYTAYGGSPTVENTAFIRNKAQYGGAVVSRSGVNGSFTGCDFLQNSATYEGGAIYTDYGSMTTVKGSKFAENTAGLTGGALYVIDRNSPEMAAELPYGVIDAAWGNMKDIPAAVYVEGSAFTDNRAEAEVGRDLALSQQAVAKLQGCTFQSVPVYSVSCSVEKTVWTVNEGDEPMEAQEGNWLITREPEPDLEPVSEEVPEEAPAEDATEEVPGEAPTEDATEEVPEEAPAEEPVPEQAE